jgi:hypothetical protein
VRGLKASSTRGFTLHEKQAQTEIWAFLSELLCLPRDIDLPISERRIPIIPTKAEIEQRIKELEEQIDAILQRRGQALTVWKVFGKTEHGQLASLFAPQPEWRVLYQEGVTVECGPHFTPLFAFDSFDASLCFCANRFEHLAPDIGQVEIWECLAQQKLPGPGLVPESSLSWLWKPFWDLYSLHPSERSGSIWQDLRQEYGMRMGAGCAALETPWGSIACRNIMPIRIERVYAWKGHHDDKSRT